MGKRPVIPTNLVLVVTLSACSGAAGIQEAEGPPRQILVQESEGPVPISAALFGRVLNRRTPPEGIRQIEESWLQLQVRFENLSKDPLRLAYPDVGCMVEVRLSPSAADAEPGPFWKGPIGCADVTRLSRLLPGQRDTADAYLITIDQIFGDSLQPGPYSVEAALRLDIEKYTPSGWEALVLDTTVVLALEALEIPHRR